MRADLIERLRGRAYASEQECRVDDADVMTEAADALASQDPVGYVTPDVLAELAAGNIGGYIFPKGTLRPENEVPLFASPVEPVVAAKAEVEGCREALKRAVAQLEAHGFDGEASGANAALKSLEARK